MKFREKVSRWIVLWLLMSLLLKCSAMTFDLFLLAPRVGYEEGNRTFEEARGSEVRELLG